MIPFFEAFITSKEDSDQISFAKADRVGLIKRAFTYSLDYSLVRFLAELMPRHHRFFVELIVFILYFGFLPYFWHGQTIMMRCLKIKIVQKDEGPLRLVNNTLRSFLIFIFISRGTEVYNDLG